MTYQCIGSLHWLEYCAVLCCVYCIHESSLLMWRFRIYKRTGIYAWFTIGSGVQNPPRKSIRNCVFFHLRKKNNFSFLITIFFRMKNLKIEVEWLGENRCYEWFTRHILESQNQLFFDVTVDVLQRWTIRSLTLSSFSLRSPSLPSKSNTVYDKRNSETKEKEIS